MEDRCNSRASGTTYHSFNDSELYVEPPRPPVTYDSKSLQHLEHLQLELQRQQREAINNREQQLQLQQQQLRRPLTATKMQRQDSGYESNTPPRRASTSNTSSSRPSVARRSSNGSSKDSSVGGVRSRFRNRPSLRRAVKTTHPVQAARTSNQSLHLIRTNTGSKQQPAAFFHFPSPDPVQLADAAPEVDRAPTPVPTPPPQTTHYWTSDRTRRLEYAAIDAATRGVKGWIMRHIVPDCFVSRENRVVSFDDDSGSVRRYRLELEDDREEKMAGSGDGSKPVRRRHKGWRFWRRRKAEAPQPAAYV